MFRDRHGHERWRCWSADHRGDAIDLVTITRRATRDAIDWLATRAGMIPDRPLPPRAPKRTPPAPAPAATMSPLVGRYVQAANACCAARTAARSSDWLHARGFDDTTIAANRLGADPAA